MTYNELAALLGGRSGPVNPLQTGGANTVYAYGTNPVQPVVNSGSVPGTTNTLADLYRSLTGTGQTFVNRTPLPGYDTTQAKAAGLNLPPWDVNAWTGYSGQEAQNAAQMLSALLGFTNSANETNKYQQDFNENVARDTRDYAATRADEAFAEAYKVGTSFNDLGQNSLTMQTNKDANDLALRKALGYNDSGQNALTMQALKDANDLALRRETSFNSAGQNALTQQAAKDAADLALRQSMGFTAGGQNQLDLNAAKATSDQENFLKTFGLSQQQQNELTTWRNAGLAQQEKDAARTAETSHMNAALGAYQRSYTPNVRWNSR
jgi:hypothetical protein